MKTLHSLKTKSTSPFTLEEQEYISKFLGRFPVVRNLTYNLATREMSFQEMLGNRLSEVAYNHEQFFRAWSYSLNEPGYTREPFHTGMVTLV